MPRARRLADLVQASGGVQLKLVNGRYRADLFVENSASKIVRFGSGSGVLGWLFTRKGVYRARNTLRGKDNREVAGIEDCFWLAWATVRGILRNNEIHAPLVGLVVCNRDNRLHADLLQRRMGLQPEFLRSRDD